jgi:superfamily II DNA helicase RecQ
MEKFKKLVCVYIGISPNDARQKMCSYLHHGLMRLVIATGAFGLGIDLPGVRHIIHWGLPTSIEEYLQQIGRAGRDGFWAHAELVYGREDKSALASSKIKKEMGIFCGHVNSGQVKCRRKYAGQYIGNNRAEIEAGKPPLKLNGQPWWPCCDLCAAKWAVPWYEVMTQ